jgi:RNA polymerase primary sigma factor
VGAPRAAPGQAPSPSLTPTATRSSARTDEDEDDEASNMSLAAMEAALKPKVLETLDLIARDYDKLADMQDSRMNATLSDTSRFPPPTRPPIRSCGRKSCCW